MVKDFTILFNVTHSLTTGVVDKIAGVIRGVSLITGNLTAEGHDLEVDDTTLHQALACATKRVKVPVKLDHGGGMKSVCGYVTNFSQDGNKLRGDWHLLKTHSEYNVTLERAEVMPECFGMSLAFKGHGEAIRGGKKAARCVSLKAIDCVTDPAANPNGLFSTVDTSSSVMPNELPAEPTLADIATLINNQNTQNTARFDQLDQTIAQQQFVIDGLQGGDEDLTQEEIDQLASMGDDQLAGLGLTREQVNAAAAEMAGAGGGEGAAQIEHGREGGGAVLSPAATATALSALRNDFIQFKARITAKELSAARAEEELALSVIEDKVIALGTQNAELIELRAQDASEMKALRLAVKTGTKPAGFAVQGIRLFDAKEQEQAGQYEGLVTAKCAELVKGGMKELSAKAEAVRFCVKNHPVEFQEYRDRGGKIQLEARK